MSRYYHEFTVGWNWWMLAASIMVGLMVVLGVMQHYMTSDLKIKGRYNEKLFAFAATVFAIIFGLMVFIESYDGTVQWFDNRLSKGESGILSFGFAGFAIIGASLIFFALLYGIAVLTSWTREGYLCEKRKKIIRERKNENTRSEIARAAEKRDAKTEATANVIPINRTYHIV